VPSRESAAAGSVQRVVADTNVYISALSFAGTADEVLAMAPLSPAGIEGGC
jgi:hypothetical protein